MARQVPAVVRAFDILELFLDREELSQPEIVTELGLSRTTVHELVNTLLECGYLAPSSVSPRKVRLGLRTFELGSRYADRLDLANEGQVVARQTSADCEETVQLAVREGSDVMVIAKVDSSHSVRLVSAVGHRVPAHCTASGKVLLASMAPEEFDRLFEGATNLRPMTQNTITEVSALREQLEQVRHGGLGWENCESNEAVACVAAPVRDSSGRVVAALSISVPIVRWSEESTARFAECARAGAAELSRRIGWRNPDGDGSGARGAGEPSLSSGGVG